MLSEFKDNDDWMLPDVELASLSSADHNRPELVSREPVEMAAAVHDELFNAPLSRTPCAVADRPQVEPAKRARVRSARPIEMEPGRQHPPRSSKLAKLGPWLALAACLLAAITFFSRARMDEKPANVPLTQVAALPAATSGPVLKRIEDVQVGDYVVTDISDDVRQRAIGNESPPWWDALDTHIDPAQWRIVDLTLAGALGERFEMTLLRPIVWLDEVGAAEGGSIELSLPEQGVEGAATVLNIGPCPPITPAPGRIVTGTITHIRGGVLNLYFDGQDKPLGVTENHRVYSVGHGDFVAAGELSVGDQLARLDGTAATVSAIERVAGEQRVYNLEIQGEHVYRVTGEGLLVHNNCLDPKWTRNYDPGELVDDHILAWALGGTDDAANIRQLALEANARKGGYEGALKRYEQWLVDNGMRPDAARSVIQAELDMLGNGVAERPVDPRFFDDVFETGL